MYCKGGGSDAPSIWNSAFVANRAVESGGALFAESECNVFSRWAVFAQNGALKKGGAVFLEHGAAPYFRAAHFANNSARFEGGCLYSGSGAGSGFTLFANGFRPNSVATGNRVTNEGVVGRGRPN